MLRCRKHFLCSTRYVFCRVLSGVSASVSRSLSVPSSSCCDSRRRDQLICVAVQSVVSSMSKATRATLSSLGAGVAVSAFHALVSARTPLTMTGALSSTRSQGQGSMSTFKADSAFMLRPRSPRPFSAISSACVCSVIIYMPLPIQ